MTVHRAGVVLFNAQKTHLAMIERHRNGAHYFLFPGGHVEAGESPTQAAQRETLEELGLKVRVVQLVATVRFTRKGKLRVQQYFETEVQGGEFGTGTGEEYQNPDPNDTYAPVWFALADLVRYDVRPKSQAFLQAVRNAARHGWPGVALALEES